MFFVYFVVFVLYFCCIFIVFVFHCLSGNQTATYVILPPFYKHKGVYNQILTHKFYMFVVYFIICTVFLLYLYFYCVCISLYCQATKRQLMSGCRQSINIKVSTTKSQIVKQISILDLQPKIVFVFLCILAQGASICNRCTLWIRMNYPIRTILSFTL